MSVGIPSTLVRASSLRVEGLSVFYGESQVLYDVTLEVPPASVVALLGRNGVGKTTLLKSITGGLSPRAGRVVLDGQDVTRAPAHKRAWGGIGYVPQGRGMFPQLTVYENLQVAAESRGGGGQTAIEEMLAAFPALATYRSKMAGTLSGGQQQQLSIARALVRRPSLLVLDEPTEGIQPNIVLEIEQAIRSLKEQRLSILLVEQFLDFALSVSDTYYVMAKGSIVAQGHTAHVDPDDITHHLTI